MKNIRDMFKSPDEKEIEARKKKLNLAREEVQESVALAKLCLDHDIFKRYRKQYERAEKTTIDTLLTFQESDPIKYAHVVSNALTELRIARTLLYGVKNDANRQLEVKK